MNQRKILYLQQVTIPNGEGSTALPISIKLSKNTELLKRSPKTGGRVYARPPVPCPELVEGSGTSSTFVIS